ncbi:class I adenylate-forming enzyme family protein [Novosphingobium sp.]|uniref:class I adenylate-forming enzyme family protein n=1 Tax=Novosphingobium sp. TaxID=1874826 RepID=UPI003BA91FFF
MIDWSVSGPECHHGRMVRVFGNRPASLWDVVEQTVDQRGESEAIVDGPVRVSYAGLKARSQQLAAYLAEHGIVRADRVAIVMANRDDYIAALLAIWWIGGIAVPINTREGASELAHALHTSGARAVFCDAQQTERLEATCPEILIASVETIAGSPAGCPARVSTDEDAAAVILFTSGTTGVAKGVVLTHCNIVHSCLHYQVGLQLGSAERSCLAVPASHVTGLVAIIATMLATGGCIIVLDQFRADRFLAVASAERMTHTIMVPAMYALCLRAPGFASAELQAWRIAGFGGAPMPPATLEAFAAQYPALAFSNVYGATETCSPATIMPAEATAARLTSVGRPVVCGTVQVVDPAGRICAPGEPGELSLAGPQVSPGYWNNPDATAREFVDGFWRSGDIGMIDADGFVYLHDRAKDLVNRGGYKIYSVEVEQALSAHPAVVEAAIVPVPCSVLGERIHAVVVLAEGALFALADARAHVASLLADYKAPDYLTVMPEALPRNANGKVTKQALRQLDPTG